MVTSLLSVTTFTESQGAAGEGGVQVVDLRIVFLLHVHDLVPAGLPGADLALTPCSHAAECEAVRMGVSTSRSEVMVAHSSNAVLPVSCGCWFTW